jgi:hypothetical protein
MHLNTIKKLMRQNGREFTTREDAEVFLASMEVEILFDESKPYGTVHGYDASMPNVAYIQNGVYFNSQGKKVG